MRSSLAVLLAVALAGGCAGTPSTEPAVPSSASTSNGAVGDKTLHGLFDAEWENTMREYPVYASTLGDRRFSDRWDDVGLAAIERRHRRDLEVMKKLDAIPRAQLSAADQLNYDLFRRNYVYSVEAHKYRMYLFPLNQREGIQTADDLADQLRFETVKDYEDWIRRLQTFGGYADQTIEVLREAARAKYVHPRVVMDRVPAQLDTQIVGDPSASPFYRPLKALPASFPPAERERLTASARAAITQAVVPAFQRLKKFFVEEYLPVCFDKVGAWQLPDGEAFYAFVARKHTTTSLTPQEIHDTGLREVARIRSEMQRIMAKVDFSGTLEEFFKVLRTDPRFYFKTSDELFNAYAAMSKRIDPKLVKVIRTLPRTPYGVEAIPANIAPDTTTAYYREAAPDGSRAGTYMVNLYKPEARPKWEMMALSLHEAVPGHHLQIALAMEQENIPKFRRHGDYTAYIEGWGLYAESLGDDMGLYDDPYAKFGQLAYEMWRAVRLVVDTGMHHLQWDRRRAIDFFLANAPRQELDVINEIDRYIAWPGQALAYKIGELKLKELRARASKALGARFDLREFNDVVLSSGALPLELLERQVDAWIGHEVGRFATAP